MKGWRTRIMIKPRKKKLKLKSRAQPAVYLDLCKGEKDAKEEWKRVYLLHLPHGQRTLRPLQAGQGIWVPRVYGLSCVSSSLPTYYQVQ